MAFSQSRPFSSSLFHKTRGLYQVKIIFRNKSGSARLKDAEERENTVFQYAGKHPKRANRLYVWGCAATGALGVERFVEPDKNLPRRVQFVPHKHTFWDKFRIKVDHIACGYGFTLFSGQENSKSVLFGTGVNTDSQMGYFKHSKKLGDDNDMLIVPTKIELPLQFPDSTMFTHLACGRCHSVIVTDKEGVYTLGNNSSGQCGRRVVAGESFRNSQIINQLRLDFDVKQVVCGQDHTLFLSSEGKVYACGLGSDGQTGQGHCEVTDEISPVVGDISNARIVHISSKGDCCLAVSDEGEVFGWGNNEYNQLSLIDPDKSQINVSHKLPIADLGKIIKVAAAGSMCSVLNENGNVFVWGYGILGKGPKVEESLYPAPLAPQLFGQNEFNENVSVKSISCGLNHFTAITNEGSLYVWGKNRTGTLGLAHKKDQYYPLKVHVPAEVCEVFSGVDHMVAKCKAFV